MLIIRKHLLLNIVPSQLLLTASFGALMYLHVELFGETFATILTDDIFNAPVNLKVVVQTTFLSETIVAPWVYAFVWLFSSVGP